MATLASYKVCRVGRYGVNVAVAPDAHEAGLDDFDPGVVRTFEHRSLRAGPTTLRHPRLLDKRDLPLLQVCDARIELLDHKRNVVDGTLFCARCRRRRFMR